MIAVLSPPPLKTSAFYIGGRWVLPHGSETMDVTDPANGEALAVIALADETDINRAVDAAHAAFASYSRTKPAWRAPLLERIIAVYERRKDEIATTIMREMGAPISLARGPHAEQGLTHLREALRVLGNFSFCEQRPRTRVVHEPAGVAALITPWNWPMNQIACKVAPALAAGCTMVLKPSEIAPLSALLFAEILDEAGVPPGVFNLVNGTGPVAGEALARHPLVDVLSLTGSNRAGVAVARAAAETVKRVSLELGGKSACILLDDVDVVTTARDIALRTFRNAGQSCAALTRLLVPAAARDAAIAGAQDAAASMVIGDPADPQTTLGPLAGEAQYARVQAYISAGIAEGALCVAGGLGRPAGLAQGCYVRPTVFTDVTTEMTIAREEIFGPVLCLMSYRTEDEAVGIANATAYGLSGAVRSPNRRRAIALAARLRTGMVHINETTPDYGAPFGGYKQSGNGREWGVWGLREFLETKALFGVTAEDTPL